MAAPSLNTEQAFPTSKQKKKKRDIKGMQQKHHPTRRTETVFVMRARDIDRMVIAVPSGLYRIFGNVVTSFDFNPGRGAVLVFLVFVISIGPAADNGSTRQQPTRHRRGTI